jgi:hypothetical protein
MDRRYSGAAVSLALLVFTPAGAAAQTLNIDHKEIGCIVAGKHPRLNACFAPTANVARGRVYFRAEGGPHWYFVEMKSDQPCFGGVLPKPRATIKKINYYVEAVDKEFAESRTTEYAPDVVAEENECRKDKLVAGYLDRASVVVGSAAGAPTVPFGFAGAGIAGAGVSGGVVVASVAGAGAAVAGGVALAKKDDETSTTTTPAGPGGPTTTVGQATTTTTTTTTTMPPTGSNGPPIGVFRVNPDPPEGNSPLTVNFNMCQSSDPDGDDLEFSFVFGDGGSDQGFCRVEHVYTASSLADVRKTDANYTARLCVGDGVPSHEQCRTFDVRVITQAPSPTTTTTIPTTTTTTSTTTSSTTTTTTTTTSSTSSTTTTTIAAITGTGGPCARDASGRLVDTSAASECSSEGVAAGSVRWSSQLDIAGASAQVVLNGRTAAFVGPGRSSGVGEAVRGSNRVEATLVQADGRAGTWRIELDSAVAPGSVRVLAGDVVSVGPTVIVFRMKGRPGERVVFAFRRD